jgi:hypothetical protein
MKRFARANAAGKPCQKRFQTLRSHSLRLRELLEFAQQEQLLDSKATRAFRALETRSEEAKAGAATVSRCRCIPTSEAIRLLEEEPAAKRHSPFNLLGTHA